MLTQHEIRFLFTVNKFQQFERGDEFRIAELAVE